MRKHLATLLAGVASMIFAGAEARAVDIYVLTNDANTNGIPSVNFGKIDSSTGAYSNISSLPSSLYSLAWVDTAQAFYTTDVTSTVTASPLKTITTSGTLSNSLGSSGAGQGMAYRTSNNTMYTWKPSPSAIGSTNLTNGAWTQINASTGLIAGPTGGGRLAIQNDTMYVTYNPNTGTGNFGTIGFGPASTFSLKSTNAAFRYMVLASDGTSLFGIYGDGTSGNQRLYTIDPDTGALTAGAFITGTGLGTYFHGAGIVPVPEPSTYALGAIASGVMAYVARRRKARRA